MTCLIQVGIDFPNFKHVLVISSLLYHIVIIPSMSLAVLKFPFKKNFEQKKIVQ